MRIFTTTTDRPGVVAEHQRLNVERCESAYGWWIDRNRDGTYDNNLDGFYAQRPELADWSGLYHLDWEGAIVDAIKTGPSHPDWATTVIEMRKCLADFKQRSPRAKFCFYDVAPWHRWAYPTEYVDGQRHLAEALYEGDGIDALAPSAYLAHGVSAVRYIEGTKHALIISRDLNEENPPPVYAFIWNRYMTTSRENAFQLIPKDVLAEHVKTIASVEVDGRSIDGFVIWSGFEWYWKEAWKQLDGVYVNKGRYWDTRRVALNLERAALVAAGGLENYSDQLSLTTYETVNSALGLEPGEEEETPVEEHTNTLQLTVLNLEAQRAVERIKDAVQDLDDIQSQTARILSGV